MRTADRPSLVRWTTFVVALGVTIFALSGCVRVRAALALSEDDMVSGDVIISSLALKNGDTGPALTMPPELTKKVHTERYNADGYVGQKLSFEKLSFTEFERLTKTISSGSYFQLGFRRSGDLVSLYGQADLTQLPPDKADVQLKIAFPGKVLNTNGGNDNGTVSWALRPGSATSIDATVQYTDTASGSWKKWVGILGAMIAGVAAFVVLLALLAHRRHVRSLRAAAAAAEAQNYR